MLLAEHTGFGYGYGFGASRTLVQGVDFNCNTSICYGIGAANHALFQQLQTTLNTYAKLGVSAYRSQLTVDGFLGDQTLTAARAAAAAALLAAPSTKTQLAQQAQILNDGLQAFLGGGSKTTIPTSTTAPIAVATAPSVPIPSPVTTASTSSAPGVVVPNGVKTPATSVTLPPQMPSAVAPTAAALTPIAPTAAKTPLWVWITAGAVGVVVVGAVGYAVLREPPPAKPASKAAFARRRRRR